MQVRCAVLCAASTFERICHTDRMQSISIREYLLIYCRAALQEMRTYKEAEQAGKHVGFELVNSVDIAVASPVAGPWYAICPTLIDATIATI